jgi:hypothetical protein
LKVGQAFLCTSSIDFRKPEVMGRKAFGLPHAAARGRHGIEAGRATSAAGPTSERCRT